MTQENLKNVAIAGPGPQDGALVVNNSIFLNMQRFADAQRVGSLLAGSTMVPEQFRNNIGNCVIALNLADRMRVDVFMLMQSMYIVHGRPGLEGKLIIALVEGTGRFSPLQYRLEGSGKTAKGLDRPDSCVAYATELKTGLMIEGPEVTWAMAEAEGWLKGRPLKAGGGEIPSKWHTMPGLMFRYRAGTFFARVHCPGALLGLRSLEELEDVYDLQQTPSGAYAMPPKSADEDPAAQVDPAEVETAFAASARDHGVADPVGESLLGDFLHRVSKANNLSVAQVKSDVIRDGADFWKTFKAWIVQEQKRTERAAMKNGNGKENGKGATPPADKKPDPPAPDPDPIPDPVAYFPCPDRNDDILLLRSYCEKCKGFSGCPAWTAPAAPSA